MMTFPSDDDSGLFVLAKGAREFSFTVEFGSISDEVMHLVIGCPRSWPHTDIPCLLPNIKLGEE